MLDHFSANPQRVPWWRADSPGLLAQPGVGGRLRGLSLDWWADQYSALAAANAMEEEAERVLSEADPDQASTPREKKMARVFQDAIARFLEKDLSWDDFCRIVRCLVYMGFLAKTEGEGEKLFVHLVEGSSGRVIRYGNNISTNNTVD